MVGSTEHFQGANINFGVFHPHKPSKVKRKECCTLHSSVGEVLISLSCAIEIFFFFLFFFFFFFLFFFFFFFLLLSSPLLSSPIPPSSFCPLS